MKTYIIWTSLVVVLAILAGCATAQKGVAFKDQQEFRQQLDQCVLVKKDGYIVRDLRFSPDYKQAMVVFANATNAAEPEIQFVLTQDRFGIYRSSGMSYFTTPSFYQLPQSAVINIALPQK